MVGRSATVILSCGLSRVFFGPWGKYEFIGLAVCEALQGVQVHVKQATQQSTQSYHRVSEAGTAALVSCLTTVVMALGPKAHAQQMRSTHLGTSEPSVVRRGPQCGARKPQSSSHPYFLNHVHNTHSLRDFQSQDMNW